MPVNHDTSFEKVITAMSEKLGKEVAFKYRDFASGSRWMEVRTEKQFEDLRGEACRLGYDTVQVEAFEAKTKELAFKSNEKGALPTCWLKPKPETRNSEP